jgi:hypothetical protein
LQVINRAGDVVLQLKSPYRDGTTHIVMSPLEFMQRLAALVPRPRLRSCSKIPQASARQGENRRESSVIDFLFLPQIR